ncbi:MAG: T9SS type A sorting domain-containing protein [Saprospiraceae bacterium]|nr:T9SS type A sorting domain-containing protein [Saprospiraceae bacterium]
MKKFIIVCILLHVNLILFSQAWIIEGPGIVRGESFRFPVELNNEDLFIHYQSVDTLYNRNSLLQIRNSKGALLKSREINRPDTTFWIYNVKKINDIIALLFFGYVGTENELKDIIATVVLVDYDLNIIFEKSFTTDKRSYAFGNIWQDSDSTFLVGYWVEPNSLSTKRYASFFYRLDTTGKVLNSHIYEPGDLNPLYRYIFTNHKKDSAFVFTDFNEIMYLDENLSPVFYKALKHCTTDSWGSLVLHPDDSSYIFLETYCNGNKPANGAVIKYDKSFNPVKLVSLPEDTYKTPGLGEFYNPLAPNSIWLVGSRVPPPAPSYPIPIIISRLDKNLNTIWTKYFEDNQARDFPWIFATADGGLLLSGTRTKSTGFNGKWTAFLMKIDSAGNFPTAQTDLNKNLNWAVTVFPNPSQNAFNFNLEYANSDFTLRLFDIDGIEVFETQKLNQGSYNFKLDKLLPGTYNYIFYQNNLAKASGHWIKH